MAHPRLYLDEDIPRAVAVGLRRRGFAATTTVETGRAGAGDEEQLRYAAARGLCLFTFNRGHFARLHGELLARGEHHRGIVVSRQARPGAVVRALSRFLAARSVDDLADRLIWLVVDSER
ncbi:MAG: DUF5615 family PIN-like protein [Deltaproteobacteria bacterium]|nr:DUF5615 family PIN-like protein [Deltaproteobacteria bacterium]